MFKALSYFIDLQDNNYPYQKGDTYPRKGYVPTDERIKELSTSANKRGVPVIVEISPDKAAKKKDSIVKPEDVINPPIEADNNDTEAEKPKRTRKAKKDA